MLVKDNKRTYYIIKAECKDEEGNVCIRSLGKYYGMGGFSCYAWVTTPKEIERYDDTQWAVKYPWDYSVYDGHYFKGGKIWIEKIETQTIIIEDITTTEVWNNE